MALKKRLKDIEALLAILTQGWSDQKIFQESIPQYSALDDTHEYTLNYGWAGIINNLAKLLGFEPYIKKAHEPTITSSKLDSLISEAECFIDFFEENTKSGQ